MKSRTVLKTEQDSPEAAAELFSQTGACTRIVHEECARGTLASGERHFIKEKYKIWSDVRVMIYLIVSLLVPCYSSFKTILIIFVPL